MNEKKQCCKECKKGIQGSSESCKAQLLNKKFIQKANQLMNQTNNNPLEIQKL